MHRLLRRTRSAELHSPPLSITIPFATATPAVLTPRPPAPAAAPAPRRAPPAALGKTPVRDDGLPTPSSPPTVGTAVTPSAVGALRTAGSVAIPRIHLGGPDRALVPSLGLDDGDVGPSSTATGLPSSIAH
ncbi:hypothetical protein D1007_32547 [Hordeum vulgare]|nr:hypothetical protein D1007_32547 [Hordeum vulgare]